jgi:hypothetical protein
MEWEEIGVCAKSKIGLNCASPVFGNQGGVHGS